MLTYTDITRMKQEQELQHCARDAAERLRACGAENPLACESKRIGMTISVGLSMARHIERTVEQVLARADCQIQNAGKGRSPGPANAHYQ